MNNTKSENNSHKVSTIAFIPVRGGSKSIPLKNIKNINGHPLVYWVIKAATECNKIDSVYVSTDSDRIKEVVEAFSFENVYVVGRSKNSATDSASTESAMIEFANKHMFDNIVLIQATSPLLTNIDLDGGISLFLKEDVDSVLSVVRQKRFIWDGGDITDVKAVNYDIFERPRRQEFPGFLIENGAFYITSKKQLLSTNNRLSGRIAAYEMSEETYFEIDEPCDWIITENIMKSRNNQSSNDLSNIKMLLTDCDGCLTDGGMYYSENGDELKKFNTRDGLGFQILREHNIITGIVTGEKVELNKRRAEKLQLDVLSIGCQNKLKEIQQICDDHDINIEDVCYIGDDINDLEALRYVGFSCCPADAVEQVKDSVDYVAHSKGGKGVIREIVDKVISPNETGC